MKKCLDEIFVHLLQEKNFIECHGEKRSNLVSEWNLDKYFGYFPA